MLKDIYTSFALCCSVSCVARFLGGVLQCAFLFFVGFFVGSYVVVLFMLAYGCVICCFRVPLFSFFPWPALVWSVCCLKNTLEHAGRKNERIKQDFTVSNVKLYLTVKLDTNYNNLQHGFPFSS